MKNLYFRFLAIGFLSFSGNSALAAVCAGPALLNIPNNTISQANDQIQDSVELLAQTSIPKTQKISSDIRMAGENLSTLIKDTAKAQSTQEEATAEVEVASIYNSANVQIEDMKATSLEEMKIEMDAQAQMTENRIRGENAFLDPSETREEYEFIVTVLQSEGADNVPQVIAALREEEKKGIVIPVVPKKVRDDPELREQCAVDSGNPQCSFTHQIFPADKVAKLQVMCSSAKRQKVQKSVTTYTKTKVTQKSAANTVEYIAKSSTDSVMIDRANEQRALSCTPDEMESGLCGEMTKEEYSQKVMESKILPGSTVSASNLLTPVPFAGEGLVEISDEERAKVEADSLDRSKEKEESAPEIVDTYRNTNQIKAALEYKDNIVNKELVPNQSPSDRKRLSSSKFQSRFNRRTAGLSLAEQSFNRSISDRTGVLLTPEINNIEELPLDEHPIKESVNGAARIDILRQKVEDKRDMFAEIQSGGGLVSDNEIPRWVMDMVIVQNELIFEQQKRLENIELLLSAILTNEVNSPDNEALLQELRGGR